MEREGEKTKLVVIDSAIFVDYLRNYQPSISFFQSIPVDKRTEILFSAITETELITGRSCNDGEVRIKVLKMLSSFTKIKVDNSIALCAGDLCRLHNVDLPDAIIAATALVNKTELFTKNIKDFSKIPGLAVKSPY
ncbi:TPA: type II toxin-antitoxin system VapC family toxin [Candidatus Woesearchaeota archaeon]|nr:type II toxin-antitoxin system VapC family toxin [Candidatus Woesearchaeota archaeon]